MNDDANETAVQRSLAWVGEHAKPELIVLLTISIGLAIWATAGFLAARDAQHRVTAIEVNRAAEDASKQAADVTTCFASARGRPRIIEILRAIAGTIDDTVPRAAVNDLIHDFQTRTPTVPTCVKIAHRYGLDPKKFDPGPGGGRTKPPQEENR